MKLRIRPRFWVMLIVVTLLVFGISFLASQGRYNRATRRVAQAQAQRNELTLQVNDLFQALEFAQTDDYVIRIARDELSMIQPGEIRYVNGAR